MPQEARGDDVWAQEGVTSASNFFIPEQEYLDWASADFDRDLLLRPELPVRRADKAPRRRSQDDRAVRLGRFSDEHVAPTSEAFAVVYSMTLAEQKRYAEMGIDAPYIQ